MIKVKDNGYNKMLATLRGAPSLAVTVGVHEEDGAQSAGAGLTLAQVAEINEFGLGVPARPAITGWGEQMRDKAPREIKDRYAAAIKAGKDPVIAIDQLAQVYAGQVQARIAGGVPPPNAPSTIAKKGSSTPLINTGTFRASIRGKVGPA